MTAAVNNIIIEQGATYRQLLTLKDNQTIPSPIDITGFTFRGSIKLTHGAATLATFTFTDNAGGDLDEADLAAGEIYMVLSAEQSSGMTIGGTSYEDGQKFWYDVEMVDLNGNVFRIMNGTATLSPEITT